MDEPTPGTMLLHSSGAIHTVSHRKATRDGWWLTDGSGLADWALHGPDWTIVYETDLCDLFHRLTDTEDGDRD